jgi:hypothetical protein
VEIKGRSETGKRGRVEPYDIWPAYVDRVLSFVDVQAIKPLRVVIDAANGMAGAMLPRVLDRLPIDAIRFFFEPDGSFPNHPPNPLLPENREFIVAKTLEEGADLGAAFDGDADRCFFVDDTGEFVPGDFVTALLAASLLEKEPGAKIIYDLRASWAVPETIERAGGVPLINRVGHAFIKQRMRDEGAAFGGEVSGHYYFRDFSQADSGVVPFLLMLELVSKEGRKLSEILADYRSRLLPDRRAQHRGRRRAGKLQELEQRFGSEGRGEPPRRAFDRGGRLAHERAAVEHGTSATAESRGTDTRADGAQARRSAGGHPLVNIELGHATARKPPLSTPPSHAWASRTRTPRASSTTAATCPTSTRRASSTTATSIFSARRWAKSSSSCAPPRSSTSPPPGSTI